MSRSGVLRQRRCVLRRPRGKGNGQELVRPHDRCVWTHMEGGLPVRKRAQSWPRRTEVQSKSETYPEAVLRLPQRSLVRAEEGRERRQRRVHRPRKLRPAGPGGRGPGSKGADPPRRQQQRQVPTGSDQSRELNSPECFRKNNLALGWNRHGSLDHTFLNNQIDFFLQTIIGLV